VLSFRGAQLGFDARLLELYANGSQQSFEHQETITTTAGCAISAVPKRARV
jgi:hypothetical protein